LIASGSPHDLRLESSEMTESIAPCVELSTRQRYIVLIAAFLGWMFAGLEISLFVLISRPALVSLLTSVRDGAAVAPAEALVTQWFAWYQAAFLFGAAIGGWGFGWLGDSRGRTRTLALSVLCYSLLTGCCYFARTPTDMLVLRFFACLGVGGAWPATVALVAEAWPNASRPLLAGLLGAAANVGFVLLGAIGYVCEITPASWRWVLLVGTAPALVGLWCLVGVPESARWLAQRANSAARRVSPIPELFRPPLRRRTLIGILLGAIPVVGTAANANWIVPWTDQMSEQQARQMSAQSDDAAPVVTRKKPDARSKALTQMTRSGGAVFGSLLGGLLATRFGRRATYFGISLLTLGTSLFVFGWLTPLHPWFQVFSFALGFSGVIYFGWLPLYLPELFPTRVRATGTGISFNTGRVVAAFVVLGTGGLMSIFGGDYSKIGVWTASIYAVGMLVILLAPNTDGARLED